MKNPAKTRQPGRLTHYHRYAIPQPQSRQRLSLQLIFQRTVKVKQYDSHKYKQPASLFIWHVGNSVIMYGVNASEGTNTRMNRMPPSLPLRSSSWRQKISNKQTKEETKSRINKSTNKELNKHKSSRSLDTRDLDCSLRERWCELALKSHQLYQFLFQFPTRHTCIPMNHKIIQPQETQFWPNPAPYSEN